MMQAYDSIIVGGGIVGMSLARELIARDPAQRVAVVEKEPSLGRHASGRNSGVLHSGIYYPAGSLKARLCSDGARRMRDYCDEHGLPISRIGKVIVPVRPEDDAQLEMLLERARANGARAELIDAARLAELEPEAFSVSGRALLSPDTAVVDPKAILVHLHQELTARGVHFLFGRPLLQASAGVAQIGAERLGYGLLLNAAGLHADRLAHMMGVGDRYTILPFKGLYYKLAPDAPIQIRRLIYPVPDLRVPFLGVHVTKSVGGDVYLGPTAIPAFGRENYRSLQGLELREVFAIGRTMARQYASNKQGFRTLVHEEGMRFLKPYFVRSARALVPNIRARHLLPSAKVGIRAQLFDRQTQELVMDFVVERCEKSLHVLNAVSPGFTSSFSFAQYVLDQLPGR